LNAEWWGNMTPPLPIRMVRVAAPICPIRISGLVLAMQAMLWCSAT